MKSNVVLEWLVQYVGFWVLFFGGILLLGALLTSCDSHAESNGGSSNNGGEQSQYGYCRVVGTYRNRAVRCYGNFSSSAYNRAHAKADECNRNEDPVSGCTGIYE